MKKLVGLFIVALMMFCVNITIFANDTIYVAIDGNYVEFDVEPQIINGRTMVPIRAIFEKMGATVEWNSATNSAVCRKEDNVVVMTVNSMDMYINNQLTRMDVSPVIVGGRTLAPARYVAEAFGARVEWDGVNSTVRIYMENLVKLYSLDGRTIDVTESQVGAYLNVGWYETLAETQQTMYSADGRTINVFKSEVSAYKNVGWYETQTQAQNANKVNTNTSTSYNPTADGYYYRTPTGKKYHLDPNCGGKNSYRTTNISGLSPCSKCAK